ncbi:hypothetical protein LTR84_013058 [Exophiala bonariae]|uniref:Uncharacterized protein n=1 Tax=Exophiala bonariae TaxID=1690606 RepID=A0AAV9NDW4_9EURO|nr:hypothetical protein LTR84_013058 [Exophiala bonariae]
MMKSQLIARMGIWNLQSHRRGPLALEHANLSLEDLFSSVVSTMPEPQPATRSGHGHSLSLSRQTDQRLPKSVSAPTVLTFTTSRPPELNRLTISSSSLSLSAQVQCLDQRELPHPGWAQTSPRAIDIFTDHLNALLHYFPQRLLLHDRVFESEATDTVSSWCIDKLLKLADYLSAGGLSRDSFDTYLTCFTHVVFYFPTTLCMSEDEYAYANEQFAASLLQRIKDISCHFAIFSFLMTAAIGCVRSSCTLDDASCAGRLLRILMNVLSDCTETFLAPITLLYHYHRDLEQFWAPVGFSWSIDPVRRVTEENVTNNAFSTLTTGAKDRELVFLSSKEQIEFAYPTDNFWVGSKFFDISHDRIARQFIGNAFIRSKTVEFIEWCKQIIILNQKTIEDRLMEVQHMRLEYEEFQDMASQLLFWSFVHEKICSEGTCSLDDSNYASSNVSRFGINIPEAFAVITSVLTKKNQWPKTFRDMASGSLQPSTFLTWVLQRLQTLKSEDGVLDFIYRYFKRTLRHQSGGVCTLLPSAVFLGRKHTLTIAEHLFDCPAGKCVHARNAAPAQADDINLQPSDVAMQDIDDATSTAEQSGIVEYPAYQTATSRLQASLVSMRRSGVASSSSSMSGEQREFRSLARQLQQEAWPFNRVRNRGRDERSADQTSISSHESWRFERVSGMP